MPHVIDYTKPSNEMVLQLVNLDQGLSLLPAQHQLTYQFESNLDNRVRTVLQALTGSPYIGDVTLRYFRLDIGLLFGANPPFIIIDEGTVLDTLDLVTHLNSMYGLNLTSSDVENNEVIGNSHVLEIKTASLAWKGSVTVEIINRDNTPPGALLVDSGAPLMLDDGSILISG